MSIMNIPIILKPDADHPTLNDYKLQAELYDRIQQAVQDPEFKIMETITDLERQFQAIQTDVIERTKASIYCSCRAAKW